LLFCSGDFEPIAVDPRAGYDPMGAADYLARARMNASSCVVAPVHVTDFAAVFLGTVDPGGSCSSVGMCDGTAAILSCRAGNGCYWSAAPSMGRVAGSCAPLAATSDPCAGLTCQAGLYCETGGVGFMGTCQPYLPDGATCTTFDACQSGACGVFTGVCETPAVNSRYCLGGSTNPVLTVGRAGTGAGEVTSNPTGICCPTSCANSFASGTMVTLTAAANAVSTFVGWSGACSGTGTCVVTMDTNHSVTATFMRN
jgi:hypothetical protein